MATYKELIYDVREMVNAYSDDSNLSDEHIAFMLMNVRNMLSKREMSNLRKTVPREALQLLCLEMEQDEKCFDAIDVVKSKLPIPTTLVNTGRGEFHKAYVPGTRFAGNVNVVDYSTLPFLKADRYAGNQLYVSLDQYNYLVVYNSENRHLLLDKLQVEGVFEDPEKAYEMSCDYDQNIDFMDIKFPISSGLISPLKNQVLQELLLKFKFTRDIQNNAEDDQISGQQVQSEKE